MLKVHHHSQIFALHFSSTSELSEFTMNGSFEASSYCAQHRPSFDVDNPIIKEDEILVVSPEIDYRNFEDNLDEEEKKAEMCHHHRKLKRHISAPELIDGSTHLPGKH